MSEKRTWNSAVREAETQENSSLIICFASRCNQSKNTEVPKMIVCINRLKQFGIFNDFNGTKIQKFGRYNLVYGWNGTGKSTLSNLFSCFELR